jgi:hypothetical protein
VCFHLRVILEPAVTKIENEARRRGAEHFGKAAMLIDVLNAKPRETRECRVHFLDREKIGAANLALGGFADPRIA